MIASILPIDVSSYGSDIDYVFWLIVILVGIWFVLAEGALLFAMIRYRRRSGVSAAYIRGETQRQIAWVIVPAAIVLILDLGIDHAAAAAWRRAKLDLPDPAVTVRIAGKQFNWIFTYPGRNGKFGASDEVSVENDLHVPVGKVIRFELSSQDVIHSFFVPVLRLKQDAVPGRVNKGWFEATRPGTYEIACTELCGFGHYTMHGTVIVQEASDYAAWVQQTWPAADAAAASH